ncbi:MAG: hypothetical protein WEB58_08360 [Planctomycetaceae bacterium]
MIQQLTSNPVVRHEHNGKPTASVYGRHCDPDESIDHIDAWDKYAVAELSADRIDHMTCDELVQAVRAAEFPALFRTDLDRHLDFLDRGALKRLAFLARQCCRNQGY